MESDAFTSRDEIWQQQCERLPGLYARTLLVLHPRQVLEAATQEDAIEMASAEVVEMGRDFAELSDRERQEIYRKNYALCAQRNTSYLATREREN